MGKLETCTQNGRMCCDGFDSSHPCHLKRNKKNWLKDNFINLIYLL